MIDLETDSAAASLHEQIRKFFAEKAVPERSVLLEAAGWTTIGPGALNCAASGGATFAGKTPGIEERSAQTRTTSPSPENE